MIRVVLGWALGWLCGERSGGRGLLVPPVAPWAADATAPHPGRLQKGLLCLDRCPSLAPAQPPVLAAMMEASSGEASSGEASSGGASSGGASSGEASASAERTLGQPHPSTAAALGAGSLSTSRRNSCFWSWFPQHF